MQTSGKKRFVLEVLPETRTVVVGVLPEQPLWVVQVAGEYAKAFDAELVCVAADATRYAYQELPDGTLLTAPVEPDLAAVERELRRTM